MFNRQRKDDPAVAWDEVRTVIEETGGWVKHADNKVAILAATFGVSITVAATNLEPVLAFVKSGAATWGFGALVQAMLTSAIVTGVWAGMAVFARSAAPPADSRFAWPSLASQLSGSAVPEPQGRLEEAWAQARALAGIASKKYKCLRVAFFGFVVFVLSTAWVFAWATMHSLST